MFGVFLSQSWRGSEDVQRGNSEDDPLEDQDSDSSEYQRDLEVALYSQIHHEAVDLTLNDDAESFTIENAKEQNGEIIRSDSPNFIKQNTEVFQLACDSEKSKLTLDSKPQPNAASTPAQELQKLKKKYVLPIPKIEDFLTISSDDVLTSPNSRKTRRLTSEKIKISKPEVLTLSSDHSDTDVVVEKHLIGGVPVSKNLKRKKTKEDVIDLTVVDSSSSDSDVLQEIMDDKNDDNIVLNVNNKGGRKIVLDAAELSDYEELRTLEQDASWNIIDSDKYSLQALSGRYYGRPNMRCNNCNEKGHLSRACPKPKKLPVCLLCGIRGHIARACPVSLCHVCSAPGHSARDCKRRRARDSDQCYRCNTWGHLRADCSDHWRQYHLTTGPGKLIQDKDNQENTKMYCFNCSMRGHFGHECTEDMMNHWSKIPFCPWVSEYDYRKIIEEDTRKRRHGDREAETPVRKRQKTDTQTEARSKDISKHTKDWLSTEDKSKTNRKRKNKKFEEKYGGEDLPRSDKKEAYSSGSQSKKRKQKFEGVNNSGLGEHSWLLDEPVLKKKKGYKNFKEKKAAMAAKYATRPDLDTDNMHRQESKKERRRQRASKKDDGSHNFKSKWVPSEKGNWTYKGKGKDRGRGRGSGGGSRGGGGGRDRNTGGGNSSKGFKSKKGFNFKAY